MTDPVAMVHARTQAFNDKDVDALVAGLDENYQYYQVRGDGPHLLAQGRDAVGENLGRLFAATGYAESTVEDVQAHGNMAVALEIDTFELPDGRRTTRSIGVYEFNGNLLRRAWNFPVEEPAT